MSIAFILFMVIQSTTSASGINLNCQPSHGSGFSVFVPFSPSSGDNSSYYRLSGFDDVEAPRSIIGSLTDGLSMFWQNADGGDVILDLVRYNAASGTVRYRLRRESSSTSPIVTVTSSDGVCVTQGNT